jgi:hypothetical protein
MQPGVRRSASGVHHLSRDLRPPVRDPGDRSVMRALARELHDGTPAYRAGTWFAIVVFPLILTAFVALYLHDRDAYWRALEEDRAVEWATFALFCLAALLAWRRAFADTRHPARPFFLALGGFCLLSALEEISWMQRILGVATPRFFLEHSDQKEINVHNVLQHATGLTTKLFAGVTLFAYGVALPIIRVRGRPRVMAGALARLAGPAVDAPRVLVLPPLVLVPGFFIASMLMWDQPTHREEEIAELMGALAFAFLVLLEDLRPRS